MTPGLPPSGAAGQYLGFDAEGFAYVIEWSEAEDAWVGAGFDPSLRGQFRLTPLVVVTLGSRTAFIVRHMQVPRVPRSPVIVGGHLWNNLRDAYGWPEAEIQDRWLRGDELRKVDREEAA